MGQNLIILPFTGKRNFELILEIVMAFDCLVILVLFINPMTE